MGMAAILQEQEKLSSPSSNPFVTRWKERRPTHFGRPELTKDAGVPTERSKSFLKL